MKKLILMVGPSGIGKTTYIKNNFPDAPVCSADHYFSSNGNYVFDGSKLGEAHKACQFKVKDLMEENVPIIVVDNTNLKKWERKPYLSMAKDYNYLVLLYVLPFSEEVVSRNIHGVSAEKVREQARKCDVPFGSICVETEDMIEKIDTL